MENQPLEENKENTTHLETNPVSAHELARKMVEDKDFHVSEEEMKNIDTSATLTPSEEKEASEMAEDLERDRPIVPQEIIGE